jgi:hypothetical protein
MKKSIITRLIDFFTLKNNNEKKSILTDRIIEGYRPTMPGAGFWGESGTPDLGRMLSDVEPMLAHPRVSHCSQYFKSGIASAKFEIVSQSSEQVGKFALEEAQRFWSKFLGAVQLSYEYGRGGAELIYEIENGLMRLACLEPFCGLDVIPLVNSKTNKYIGIRIKGTTTGGYKGDLPGPTSNTPGKAWYHAHNKRYSRWFGTPQNYGAWRPWRRLAGKDGAEDIVDGGIYRFAFAPPIGRYPPDDQAPSNVDGVYLSNRDKMRQMLENLKSGGVVAMSSLKDEGSYRWDVHFPTNSIDVAGLIAYTNDLEKAISLGCGVPPELIEASEVGSGYSGRAIPLEAFYLQQQTLAENLLQSWYTQIGKPLISWNFGPNNFVQIRVLDLLKTRIDARQQTTQQQSQQPPINNLSRFINQ